MILALLIPAMALVIGFAVGVQYNHRYKKHWLEANKLLQELSPTGRPMGMMDPPLVRGASVPKKPSPVAVGYSLHER